MLILGCGYIGRRVARHYLGRDRVLQAVVRGRESRDELVADGIPAVAWDLASPAPDEIDLIREWSRQDNPDT